MPMFCLLARLCAFRYSRVMFTTITITVTVTVTITVMVMVIDRTTIASVAVVEVAV